MEIDGHPTQDILEELEQRGAIRMIGTTAGPSEEALRFLTQEDPEVRPGLWFFLPEKVFQTGMDDSPL